MTPDKETLLQELLHEKLGELIHYKSTLSSWELGMDYKALIDATHALLDAKLPLPMKGVNNSPQPFFDWKSIKMEDKDFFNPAMKGIIKQL